MTKSEFVKSLVEKSGQNKKTILLTIKCFKSLCLKAQTKKSNEIHEYYMKMEEILQQIIEEETDELRLQLQEKEKKIFLGISKISNLHTIIISN
jgi:phage anti-repressor protein